LDGSGQEITQVIQRARQPDHRQAYQCRRVVRRYGFEQDETGAFNLEAAGTVVRLIMAQISVGETAVEATEPDGRFISVLESRAGNRVEYTDRGQEPDFFSCCRQKLLHSSLVVTGLAKCDPVQDRQLVRAND